jgi:hypothetical protein
MLETLFCVTKWRYHRCLRHERPSEFYGFIAFGAMDAAKPCKFHGLVTSMSQLHIADTGNVESDRHAIGFHFLPNAPTSSGWVGTSMGPCAQAALHAVAA